MVFQRTHPEDYPKIYKRFVGRRTQNEYWIQDLTEEYFAQVIDGFVNHFLDDELVCKYLHVTEDKVSTGEFRKLWQKFLPENLSLICLTKSSNGEIKIAGYNCLYTSYAIKKQNYKFNGATMIKANNLLEVLEKQRNILHELNVNQCIKSMGLFVHRDDRRDGIAEELLLARVPLCKAVNCKLLHTTFPCYISQHLAKKCGYLEISSVDYDDLGRIDDAMKIDGVSEHTRTCKTMYKLCE